MPVRRLDGRAATIGDRLPNIRSPRAVAGAEASAGTTAVGQAHRAVASIAQTGARCHGRTGMGIAPAWVLIALHFSTLRYLERRTGAWGWVPGRNAPGSPDCRHS